MLLTFYSDRNLDEIGRNGGESSVLLQPSNHAEILQQDDAKSQALKVATPIALGATASGDEDSNSFIG